MYFLMNLYGPLWGAAIFFDYIFFQIFLEIFQILLFRHMSSIKSKISTRVLVYSIRFCPQTFFYMPYLIFIGQNIHIFSFFQLKWRICFLNDNVRRCTFDTVWFSRPQLELNFNGDLTGFHCLIVWVSAQPLSLRQCPKASTSAPSLYLRLLLCLPEYLSVSPNYLTPAGFEWNKSIILPTEAH